LPVRPTDLDNLSLEARIDFMDGAASMPSRHCLATLQMQLKAGRRAIVRLPDGRKAYRNFRDFLLAALAELCTASTADRKRHQLEIR